MNRCQRKFERLPMILPTIKQIPENKPRCLFSVTSSVGNTAFNGSGWTIDATDTRRCSVIGNWTWRRWMESASTREEDDDMGVTRLL